MWDTEFDFAGTWVVSTADALKDEATAYVNQAEKVLDAIIQNEKSRYNESDSTRLEATSEAVKYARALEELIEVGSSEEVQTQLPTVNFENTEVDRIFVALLHLHARESHDDISDVKVLTRCHQGECFKENDEKIPGTFPYSL